MLLYSGSDSGSDRDSEPTSKVLLWIEVGKVAYGAYVRTGMQRLAKHLQLCVQATHDDAVTESHQSPVSVTANMNRRALRSWQTRRHPTANANNMDTPQPKGFTECSSDTSQPR